MRRDSRCKIHSRSPDYAYRTYGFAAESARRQSTPTWCPCFLEASCRAPSVAKCRLSIRRNESLGVAAFFSSLSRRESVNLGDGPGCEAISITRVLPPRKVVWGNVARYHLVGRELLRPGQLTPRPNWPPSVALWLALTSPQKLGSRSRKPAN